MLMATKIGLVMTYKETVCSCHATYAFQSEFTLCNCLNVKERLARSRFEIWSLSGCNWTRTLNHLVLKRTLNHVAKLAFFTGLVYKLSGSGFESSCSYILEAFIHNVARSFNNGFLWGHVTNWIFLYLCICRKSAGIKQGKVVTCLRSCHPQSYKTLRPCDQTWSHLTN